MAVPAVNSVPDSAGCPRAHQRRVPPTSPAFPRPPPRSGPHPQPPGPSRVFSVPSCPLVSLPVPTWPPPSPWPPPEVGPGHFRPDFLRHDANRKSRRRAAALTCPPVYAARPERDAAKKGFRPLGVPPMVGTSLSPRIPKSQRGQAERDCGAWVQASLLHPTAWHGIASRQLWNIPGEGGSAPSAPSSGTGISLCPFLLCHCWAPRSSSWSISDPSLHIPNSQLCWSLFYVLIAFTPT